MLAGVIAHRGASGEAPENTIAAVSLAADQGAQSVEIDVSISKDHIPFVHHDDTLDRCTNASGYLSEHSAEELDRVDASKGMKMFAGEPLPRLSAVIDVLARRSISLNLEIKPRAGLEAETVEAICNVIKAKWPSELHLVFSSFNWLSLDLARQHLPEVRRGLLVEEVPENWAAMIERYDCENIHCDGAQLTTDQIEQLSKSDLGIYCYTVNDEEKAKWLIQQGVNGIFTDFPERMIRALRI